MEITERKDPNLIKYGELDKAIVEKLEKYETLYFREDKPVPFEGLEIFPAQVRNFEEFSACTSCLTLNKNEDPKGISLSHLDYLARKLEDPVEGGVWSNRFQRLCEIIFHIKNGFKCEDCGEIIQYTDKEFVDFINKLQKAMEAQQKGEEVTEEIELICPKCGGKKFVEMIKIFKPQGETHYSLSIDGHIIDKKGFNLLRQIVLFQNFYDYYDDSHVDPEIKRDHDERIRLEQMKNDVHATIEKKVVCLSIATHYSFEEIYNMPIRKFSLALATVDDLINYKIMKQSVMSGFVSLPKGQSIEHWIYKPSKDIYGDSYKTT